jgi:hypothetical protein
MAMNAWQVGFIEPEVFVVVERIRQDAALVDLGHQPLNVDALIRGPTRGQQIGRGRQQVAGAEDVPLCEVVARCGQFHQTVEQFSGLPRFEGHALFKVVMTVQKCPAIEELDPTL